MNVTVVYVSTAIIGVVLSILSILLWKNRYGNQFITAELIPKRQVYKNISVFGLLLFMSGLLYFYEALGYTENTTFLWLLAPCLMVTNSRTMFDPYYTTEIVSHIDELCLYLRPFQMNTKNLGKAHGFLWIPEPIEKLLCGRLEKKVAPVFCIGDPNSAVPTTLRSSGIYATDAEWKSAVESLADKSSLIVLFIMETEGCMWELRKCIGKYLDKTMFVVSSENNLMLLNKFLSESNVSIPNCVFENQDAIALYLSDDKSKWHVSSLRSSFDINKVVANLISHIESVRKIANEKKNSGYTLVKPFKEKKVDSVWAHVVSLMLEPFWYIAYNRWPKLWILLLVIYSVFAFAFPLFITQDAYLYLVCSLLLFTPWLWLGPRITSSCNRWGSREVVRRTNVALMKWVIVFGLITFLLGIVEA